MAQPPPSHVRRTPTVDRDYFLVMAMTRLTLWFLVALVRVLPAHEVRGAELCVVMPSSRFVPTRVRLLFDFLVAELAAAFGRG